MLQYPDYFLWGFSLRLFSKVWTERIMPNVVDNWVLRSKSLSSVAISGDENIVQFLVDSWDRSDAYLSQSWQFSPYDQYCKSQSTNLGSDYTEYRLFTVCLDAPRGEGDFLKPITSHTWWHSFPKLGFTSRTELEGIPCSKTSSLSFLYTFFHGSD